MKQRKAMSRDELLSLPVSISSWIILRDYITTHADLDIFKKLLSDYQRECPLFELENIFDCARRSFKESEFLHLLEFLFGQHHDRFANTPGEPVKTTEAKEV